MPLIMNDIFTLMKIIYDGKTVAAVQESFREKLNEYNVKKLRLQDRKCES